MYFLYYFPGKVPYEKFTFSPFRLAFLVLGAVPDA